MNPDDVEIEFDRYMLNWLTEMNIGILISSYKAATLFCLGRSIDKTEDQLKLSMWLTGFPRVTGLHYQNQTLWTGLQSQLLKLVNIGETNSGDNGSKFDITFMPRKSYITSDVDIHDVVIDQNNQPFFIATQCNSICTVSESLNSFEIFWRPPWIDRPTFEDRCHLNGLCVRDGIPRYVTSVSRSNVVSGWREHTIKGGIVYDIHTNEVICEGLSMPHSPRWFMDRLWILEAGSGHFGYVNKDGQFEPKTFIPGFLRGLSFVSNKYAVVCSSNDRHEKLFQGLSLGERLAKECITAKCGLFVISLDSYDVVHHLVFNKGPIELFDVVVIPNCIRPVVVNLNDPILMTNRTVEGVNQIKSI